jgi:hypothetical protein
MTTDSRRTDSRRTDSGGSDARWQEALEKCKALEGRVEAMEAGGDLEGLIEEGLEEITRELYAQLLAAREGAASIEAGFSPSGVSSVRQGGDESREGALAPSPDAPRDGGF